MCGKSKIIKKEYIGKGANWKVYHIEFEPFMINGKIISQAVIKETINNQDAEYYVSKYRAIVKSAVPTVSFCVLASDYFEEYNEQDDAVVCEDLNLNFPKEFYVTANSVRKCTESYPKCEGFLLENKFTEISNFNTFLKHTLEDISLIHDVSFDDDSFFFGVVMEGNGTISLQDYRIADFDSVCIYKEELPKNLSYGLRKVFLIALEYFCTYFENGTYYRKIVQNELKKTLLK